VWFFREALSRWCFLCLWECLSDRLWREDDNWVLFNCIVADGGSLTRPPPLPFLRSLGSLFSTATGFLSSSEYVSLMLRLLCCYGCFKHTFDVVGWWEHRLNCDVAVDWRTILVGSFSFR
jgi:hypothetical protein